MKNRTLKEEFAYRRKWCKVLAWLWGANIVVNIAIAVLNVFLYGRYDISVLHVLVAFMCLVLVLNYTREATRLKEEYERKLLTYRFIGLLISNDALGIKVINRQQDFLAKVADSIEHAMKFKGAVKNHMLNRVVEEIRKVVKKEQSDKSKED